MKKIEVRDNYGKVHEVLWICDNVVKTANGAYIHITKCTAITGRAS